MSPEQIFAERIRAIDATLAAGRASAEIAGRETRRDGQLVLAEVKLTLPDPAFRAFLLRLLGRHGVRFGTRPRHRTSLYAVAPEVFAIEVLEPALVDMQRAVDEYTTRALARTLSEIVIDGTGVHMHNEPEAGKE